jgi:hypothetical protein
MFFEHGSNQDYRSYTAVFMSFIVLLLAEFAFAFLSFGVSLFLSFFISSYLAKKQKEIAFWALAFNFEMLFLIIDQCVLFR